MSLEGLLVKQRHGPEKSAFEVEIKVHIGFRRDRSLLLYLAFIWNNNHLG